jgi:hypothetical protein
MTGQAKGRGRAHLRVVQDPEWYEQLSRNRSGRTLPSLPNALVIMANDEKLQGLITRVDNLPGLTRPVPPFLPEFGTVPGPYPRVMDRYDQIWLMCYLQQVWSRGFGKRTVKQLVELLASREPDHSSEAIAIANLPS